MTYEKLIEEVQRSAEFTSKAKAREVLRCVLGAMEKALLVDGRVVIPGLGTFTVKERKERNCLNPHTREVVKLPAKNVVRYRPAPELAKAVNREVKKIKKTA